MDLRLYWAVLWRFRYLVLAGLLLAVGLTFLSVFRVSSHGVAYRQQETWQSDERLLITQGDFKFGSARSNPFQNAGQAVFLAQIVNSGQLRTLIRRSGPLTGTYLAAPAVDRSTNFQQVLPILVISGLAILPDQAVRTATRVSAALRSYLVEQQASEHVDAANKLVLQQLAGAGKPKLVQGRRLTLPIVVFLTILIATIGLAFIFENLRPRVKVVSGGMDQTRSLSSRDREAGSGQG